jgi:hypothetical protein
MTAKLKLTLLSIINSLVSLTCSLRCILVVYTCHPKKMVEFGFVQTVKDNLKLISKRQIASATQAEDFSKR